MTPLPEAIKHTFFEVMHGELAIELFEQWVYSNDQLAQLLTEEDYLWLISFNYKQRGGRHELFKILSQFVSLGEYETYKLKHLLKQARQRSIALPKVLEQFYDLYCHGYYFLESMGMGYGLSVTYLTEYGGKHWTELNTTQLQALVDSISSRLEAEINQVEHWLNSGKVVLTGEQDELGRYGYVDHRSMTEKNTFTDTPIYTPKPRGQRWRWPWS